MMHSSDEDIELFSVDRFGSIEPDSLQKNKKIIKNLENFRYGSPRQNLISSTGFGLKIYLSSIVSL